MHKRNCYFLLLFASAKMVNCFIIQVNTIPMKYNINLIHQWTNLSNEMQNHQNGSRMSLRGKTFIKILQNMTGNRGNRACMFFVSVSP
jgi:hypothetical protein